MMDEQRDWGLLAADLATWIGGQVAKTGMTGTVVGISGGLDSAVVAALCRRAVGDRAHGLILPCHSEPTDLADALAVARHIGIQTITVDLAGAYDALLDVLPGCEAPDEEAVTPAAARLARANLKPRLRMSALYYLANRRRLLVVGTSNRSEIHVGYATKHGDAGVDLQPLAKLLKREVRALAAHLAIPPRIIDRPPSAGLWPGQTDEAELGLTYAELDEYLASGEGRPEAVARIDRLHQASKHKRRLPATPEA